MPRRLTHHPDDDEVVGWTADGGRVPFRSSRASVAPRYHRLFTVSEDGGFPEPVDLPSGYDGALSPTTASCLARMPTSPAFAAWRRYRGGQTTSIAIASMKDARLRRSRATTPTTCVRCGSATRSISLSDRDGPVTLFAYDTKTRAVRQALARTTASTSSRPPPGRAASSTSSSGLLFFYGPRPARPAGSRSASLPTCRRRGLALRRGGRSDPERGALTPPRARGVRGARRDPPGAGGESEACATSAPRPARRSAIPTGHRTEIDRLPLRRRTASTPLFLRDQTGLGAPRKFALGDARRLLLLPGLLSGRAAGRLSRQPAVALGPRPRHGKNLRIATDTYETPARTLDPSWSPDSRFVAYTRLLPNHLHAVFVVRPRDPQGADRSPMG